MMKNLLRLGALLCVLSCFSSTHASAQQTASEHSARHHFRLGLAHYESGAFRQAATEFESAYELSQRPELQHNLYVAYRDANDFRRAAEALRRYLNLLPDADNATVLRGRLEALDATLARGDVAPASPSTDGAASQSETGHAPSNDDAPESLSPVGFVVAGSGVALLGASLATGLLASAASDELASRCPDGSCPAGYDHEAVSSEGQVLAWTTDALLGVGGALLITGAVLIAALRESEDLEGGASCSPEGCVGVLRGRF